MRGFLNGRPPGFQSNLFEKIFVSGQIVEGQLGLFLIFL